MRLAVLLAGAVALALFAPRAQALRCGSDLVREGDLAFEVREACGEPDWVRSWHAGHGGDEIWHYNRGPNDLIRILHLRDGRLRRIQTGGRGFVVPNQPGKCRPADLVTGMSALELLQRCGEPVQREVHGLRHHVDRTLLPHHKHGHGFQSVFIEDWYYDFGDNYLVRRVRLMDGIVARIDTKD